MDYLRAAPSIAARSPKRGGSAAGCASSWPPPGAPPARRPWSLTGPLEYAARSTFFLLAMAAQYVLYESLRYDLIPAGIVGWRLVRQYNIVDHLQCGHQLSSSSLPQDRPARLGHFHRQEFSRTRALT